MLLYMHTCILNAHTPSHCINDIQHTNNFLPHYIKFYYIKELHASMYWLFILFVNCWNCPQFFLFGHNLFSLALSLTNKSHPLTNDKVDKAPWKSDHSCSYLTDIQYTISLHRGTAKNSLPGSQMMPSFFTSFRLGVIRGRKYGSNNH